MARVSCRKTLSGDGLKDILGKITSAVGLVGLPEKFTEKEYGQDQLFPGEKHAMSNIKDKKGLPLTGPKIKTEKPKYQPKGILDRIARFIP